jgi:hypothetical protein
MRFGPPITFVLVAAASLGGCVVPSARYEEARSAIRVEQEAHRRTQDRLREISQQIDTLQATLSEREKRLAGLETDLDQAKLESDVAGAERRFAVEIVEQLRGELGRTGQHLRDITGEKHQLAQALDAAEKRARQLALCETVASDNASIVRDLSLSLHAPIQSGDVEIAVLEGRAVIRIASSEITGEVVEENGQKVLAAVASVTQRHPESRVSIRETGTGAATDGSAKRLRSLGDALVKAGLGSTRIELSPAAPPSKGPSEVEIGVFAPAEGAPPVEG